MIVIHLQEVKGPKQSYCGLRALEIRRRGEKLYYVAHPYEKKLALGYRWCTICSNHPALQLKILGDIDL
jgi:hypothetical protein